MSFSLPDPSRANLTSSTTPAALARRAHQASWDALNQTEPLPGQVTTEQHIFGKI